MTRDMIQGFIDGYIAAAGDLTALKTATGTWMDKHPVYPQSKAVQDIIVADLESYRGVPKTVPAAAPVDREIAP